MRNLAFLIIGLLGVVAVYWLVRPAPHQSGYPAWTASIVAAQQAYAQGDPANALKLVNEVLDEPLPQELSDKALMLAANCSAQLDDTESAIAYYAKIPDTSDSAARAYCARSELCLLAGNSTEAFTAIQKSLSLDPTLIISHRQAVLLCNMFGRRREAVPSIMYLLHANDFDPMFLFYLGNLAKETVSAKQLENLKSRNPQDFMPNLGLAQLAMLKGKYTDAESLLRELLRQTPHLIEAQAQLGSVLMQIKPAELSTWNEQLPESEAEHPDIWFVRGEMLAESNPPQAIRCYAEAIDLDPNHIKALISIGRLLGNQGEANQAGEVLSRVKQLQQLHIVLERCFQDRRSTELMRQAANLTYELGRPWESLGWCIAARAITPELLWINDLTEKLTALARLGDMPQTLASANLAASFGWLDAYPAPQFNTSSQVVTDQTHDGSSISSLRKVALGDVAQQAGLNFVFDNHQSSQHKGHRMYQTTGGGVGVIDFDQDGWSDLFFAQGGNFPPTFGNSSHQDRLFRNVCGAGELHFMDVTDRAKLSDFAFGQGVCIGDINADGFDDIYVCNIGSNQLWINCGDGTFRPAGEMLPPDDHWTVSAVMVDLNHDGRPEIYDANYLHDERAFKQMCQIGGLPRSCSPLEFAASPDRLLSLSETSELHEVSIENQVDANSFGVVAFKTATDDRQTHLFVSVDQQANLFGTFRLVSHDRPGRFEDSAVISGVAYDHQGRAQACMGIAAGDVNGDGQVDLYVTNYHLEYNTLYLQNQGVFSDQTPSSATVTATTEVLGFGTQFFDAQRDGFSDIFVANGHVDDQTHMNVPYRMPAQLFQGVGNGRFELVQVDRSTNGNDFFNTLGLGRSVAIVDFDRDGLVDVVCTQLEHAPANLLQNRSEALGSYVRVRLVGTQSDRNAFCTQAELRVGSYRQQMQLIAGSGFEASNQRVLEFSIPERFAKPKGTQATLQIHWPSGTVDTHESLLLDRSYTAVEGQRVHAHETVPSR